MTSAHPFLYQRLVDQTVAKLDKTLIHGGPGMGKTLVLQRIHAVLVEGSPRGLPHRTPLTFVRAGTEDDFARVMGWLDSPSGTLLVDDFDHLYNSEMELKLRNLFDKQIGQSTGESPRPYAIIATSTTPSRSQDVQVSLGLNEKPIQHLQEMKEKQRIHLNPIMVDSRGLSSFEMNWLTPWPDIPRPQDARAPIPIWKQRAEICIREVLSAELSAHGFHWKEDPRLVERILGISGGHPALLGTVTSQLLYETLVRARSAGQSPSEAMTDAELEEHLFDNHGDTIFRALHYAEQQLHPEQFEVLLEMAMSNGSTVSPGREGTIFSRAGLARIEGVRHVIPCPLIRDCINQYGKRRPVTVPRPQAGLEPGPPPDLEPGSPLGLEKTETKALAWHVNLVPDELAPDHTGVLRWKRGSEQGEIPLTPAEWKIIMTLASSAGILMDVPSIVAGSGQKNDTAVRSALQRLLDKLKLVGLEGLIVNVRKKGYRYNTAFLSS